MKTIRGQDLKLYKKRVNRTPANLTSEFEFVTNETGCQGGLSMGESVNKFDGNSGPFSQGK